MEAIVAVLEAARQAGEGWVMVMGEPDFYRRFGFMPAPFYGLGDDYSGGVCSHSRCWRSNPEPTNRMEDW